MLFENLVVYEIMWKNTLQPDRPQITIRRMLILCYIPKATNTHSKYVTLIAFHCNSGCTKAPQFYASMYTLSGFRMCFLYRYCEVVIEVCKIT
jgi:hypothetical protein